MLSPSAHAGEALEGRVETNIRAGNERSILMTEFWVPFAQDTDKILYGDLRMMGDDQDNREGNLGIGYRQVTALPGLGEGVIGVNGWMDRRITARGSTFHQVTAGAEWLGESMDFRLNGYLPLSDQKEYIIPNTNPQGPALAGTGIVVDTDGRLLEEPQHGFDAELGWELGQSFEFIRNHTDSLRIYGGGYYFDGDNTERITGWRTRFSADVSQNIQIGARFQHDDERGAQGFLEATFRFPFGNKKSYRREGLRARLDESPERDIDIVAGSVVTDTGSRVPVLNKATGQAQEILSVDNTAAGGGDGSTERPFNTLASAQAAASAQTIIYVKRGDGTDTNQNQGITLNKQGQQLIGAGTDFIYDSGRFTTANGSSPFGTLIAPATSAPVISNTNANGDGVTISADDITVTGITVDGANRDGIVVRADSAAASAQNITIQNVTAQNNRIGLYIRGANSGAVSAKVQSTVTTANSQHGMAVYDDTDGIFEVDLGGGSMGSTGNNVLAANTLEDLAIDYDGRTLAVQNNWWGQASGPDTDAPNIGIAPQIYYGAPVDNSDLLGHWTIDTQWVSGSTIYDRSGLGNNGTVGGGLSLANQVAGHNGEALNFDGVDDLINLAGIHSSPFSGDLTIASWIRTSNIVKTEMTILGEWGATLDRDYQLYLVRGVIFFKHANAAGTIAEFINSGLNVADGDFHHVAVTADFPTYTFYVDGAPLASGALTFDIAATPGSAVRRLSGSAAFPSTIWDGDIDEVSIHKRALLPSEIAELYRMDTASSVSTSGFLAAAP